VSRLIYICIFIGRSRCARYNIDTGPCLKARTLAMLWPL